MRFFILGFVVVLVIFGAGSQACASQDRVLTLWPLLDYRSSAEGDYRNFSLIGPLFEFNRAPLDSSFSLRPFYSSKLDDGRRFREWLYPLASQEEGDGRRSTTILGLFTSDSGLREEGSENEHMLFPFLFWRTNHQQDDYFAFFPLWGTIKDKFSRDLIRFRLFPLYSQTHRGQRQTSNYLWPFFASIEGPQESGFKAWPLWGSSSKTDEYRKLFVLWPFYFSEDLKLNTDNPETFRALYPFYSRRNSALYQEHYYPWPFFGHVVDRNKDYEQWSYPWPLLGHSKGSYKSGIRLLPFYSRERIGGVEKTWYLWPFFRDEKSTFEYYGSRHFRLLFFLFNHLEEYGVDKTAGPEKKRVSLWPLMGYEEKNGVSRFYTLSLLEPFFPDNEKIVRNWSPFWRLYQRVWDQQGNMAENLLWNLYWKERRGNDLFMELFPLFQYKNEDGQSRQLDLLKGLIRYRNDQSGRSLRLFFLPWSIPLPASRPTTERDPLSDA